jgi:phosphoribosylformimino-5-aminoimidazole carboxamide ribotide isomerase
VQIVPSIDIQTGRSRLVFWPGASSGVGTATDKPERIAQHFVGAGARMLHLVDIDGAQKGAPANTEVIQRISRTVAVPLQLAGGVDGPRQIELAFACGATRVVVPLWAVAESVDNLRECLSAAGDWMSVGIDARADRLAEYPWHGPTPTIESLCAMLASEGVRKLVVSHWTRTDLARIAALSADSDIEIQLAGGASEMADVEAARAAGINSLILGEALFSGAIDFAAANQPSRGALAVNG